LVLTISTILDVFDIVNTKRIGYDWRMAGTDKMINIGFSPELLERIEDFQFANRFKTRVEAIRWLVGAALDKKLKPAKTATAKGD
jgi:hypothetical protein